MKKVTVILSHCMMNHTCSLLISECISSAFPYKCTKKHSLNLFMDCILNKILIQTLGQLFLDYYLKDLVIWCFLLLVCKFLEWQVGFDVWSFICFYFSNPSFIIYSCLSHQYLLYETLYLACITHLTSNVLHN